MIPAQNSTFWWFPDFPFDFPDFPCVSFTDFPFDFLISRVSLAELSEYLLRCYYLRVRDLAVTKLRNVTSLHNITTAKTMHIETVWSRYGEPLPPCCSDWAARYSASARHSCGLGLVPWCLGVFGLLERPTHGGYFHRAGRASQLQRRNTSWWGELGDIFQSVCDEIAFDRLLFIVFCIISSSKVHFNAHTVATQFFY